MEFISREDKTAYIKRNTDLYDTFILGGSKAGGYRPEVLNDLNDSNAYNFHTTGGCFYDYENYIRFLLTNNTQIKEIILNLSSHEISGFIRNKSLPSYIQSNCFAKFYYRVMYYREKYLSFDRFWYMRNALTALRESWLYDMEGGARIEIDEYYYELYENNVDIDLWNIEVFNYWGEYETCLADLFNLKPEDNLPFCNQNIDSLGRIKSMCDEKGVKLTVIIAPTFIAEVFKYASPDFAQYLKNLVNVCPEGIWNFGGINQVSLNPYDFLNGGHCFKWVLDEILQIIYGEESVPNTSDMNAFGVLLTPENIDSYLASQTERWQELKTEFEQTGTIKLQTKDDASYIGPDIKL